MNEKIEAIVKYISPEAFNRAIEVMNIFGVDFPGYSKIYSVDGESEYFHLGHPVECSELKDSDKHFVMLLDPNGVPEGSDWFALDQAGYFEFGKGYLRIVFEEDGLFHEWYRNQGGKVEHLQLSAPKRLSWMDKFTATFTQMDDGLITSTLKFNHEDDGIPSITSDLESITVQGTNPKCYKTFGLEEYSNIFRRLLNDERFIFKAIPASVYRQEFSSMIPRIFERPINNMVNDIRTTDQSWRFPLERIKIAKKCEALKRASRRQKNKIIKTATKNHELTLLSANSSRDSSLELLDSMETEYKTRNSEEMILGFEPRNEE